MKLHRLILSKVYRRLDALKAENEQLKKRVRQQLERITMLEYAPDTTSPLYFRGQPVILPGDKMMVPYVLRNGAWDEELLEFARESLASNPGVPYYLFDVGANVGLVVRQLLAQCPSFVGATCVEPDPRHFAFLQKNNAAFSNITFLNQALSSFDGKSTLYRDANNIGHCSLLDTAVEPGPATQSITVECRKADDDALLKPVPANARLFWKSDTEGYDEIIMTALSMKFWDRVDFAAIELLRAPKPAYDEGKLKAILDSFPRKSFATDPGAPIATSDVLGYLHREGVSHCNVYLSK